jgi:Fe-S cluster assembly protein SufD
MTQQLLTRPIVTASEATVRELSAKNDEPVWLKERRLDAWRAYAAMDLPDAGDEEWRRTDVRALPLEGLTPGELRVNDGTVPDGVTITDLAKAASDAALVRDRLYSIVPADEWKYLALNAALCSAGTFVHVPRDAELREPVHLVQEAAGEGAVFPRTLIIVERNARVVIIDETASADGKTAFASGAVEIVVGDGAKVEYYSINRWGDGVYNFSTVRAILGRDAEFTALAAGIGSKLTKMRIDVEMPQPGARTQLLGVSFGSGDQHFDYNTLQNHVGDHTISDLQFKSALTDSASLVWYGITRINPTAGGSEANQTSRNLLLSDEAKAAPIPILEIEAWDVSKCSHGATAGPVEEGELFYLQSRAIPKPIAEQMLVEGFFADVIDRVPNADVRRRVMDEVLRKMGGGASRVTAEEIFS